WREALKRVEALKAKKNQLAKEIGVRKSRSETADDLFNESRVIGHSVDEIEKWTRLLEEQIRQKSLFIPNLPHETVPDGLDAEKNLLIKEWGEKPVFTYQPKTHVELGESLGILDFQAASKITGSGFVVYRKAGARLERALIQFLLDLHVTEHHYQEV